MRQPSGTVTLVFTDIEGSTALLRELGRERYQEALAEHRTIVREACARQRGYEVDYEGDSFFYAFASAGAALAAVEEATRQLEGGPVRLRVGIHTGEPGLDSPKYVGLDVHLAARVMSAAHGGQVLLTRAKRELVEGELKDLGQHRLKDIAEPVSLYQLGTAEFSPPRTLSRSTLPRPPTAFLGRKRELKELLTLLRRADTRLVTLTGPGGTGKTRLALEVGGRLEAEREVLFVDLSAATSEEAPLAALATALGVREQAQISLLEVVSTALAARKLLLIFDNCEQILDPVAALVETLTADGQDLRLLATSREPLHVAGERRVALNPLPLPDRDDPRPERADAVRLFLERLRTAAPAFAADAATVAAAAAVVRGLDGLPLAIELAAARAALLGVVEVRDRLGERFRILKATGRSAGGRHQSLEAALDWSYELLAPEVQAAFRRLSVFPTGFSLAAAEAIVGPDALELVPALADASLLSVEDARGGAYRYRLLETIRAYARDKLAAAGETNEAQQRLTSWAVATAQEAAATLNTEEEKQGLSVLDRESDNCAAPFAWALEAEPAEALRLALALSGWRTRRGRYTENIGALKRALEADPDAAAELRARVLFELAAPISRLGDRPRAERVATEAAGLFSGVSDAPNTVRALVRLAETQRNQGRLAQATATANQALELAQQDDDPNGVVTSLSELGCCSFYAADFAGAYGKAREALQVPAARLNADAQAQRGTLLAVTAWFLGKLDEAETACLAGLAASTDEWSAHQYRGTLSAVREEQGRRLEALQLLRQTFEFATSVGDTIEIGNALDQFAAWALASGRSDTAALLIGAAERASPHNLPLDEVSRYAKRVALTERELGAETYAEATARGSELKASELLDLVRDLDRQLRAEGEHGPRPSALFPSWRSDL